MEPLKKFTLTAILERSRKNYSSRPALSFVDSEPISYSEFGEIADKTAAFLNSCGIKGGDRVALLGENMPNWGAVYFGIARAGAVIVPILPDFHPKEIENILDHSESDIVFVSRRIYEKVQTLNTGKRFRFILLDDLTIIEKGTLSADLKNVKNRKYFYQDSMELISVETEEEDLAAIIYTAGTTGSSKGVMLTHRNICSNAVTSNKIAEIQPGYTMLSILPLSHSYECTLGFIIPIYTGATVYYLRKPPSASILLPALKKVKPHLMLSVPLLIEKIIRQSVIPGIEKKKVLSFLYSNRLTHGFITRVAGKKLVKTFGGRLYFFGIGGAGLAPDVEKFLREAKFPYAIGYGLTETSPLIAGSNAQKTRYTATGTVIDGGELKIDKPNPETGVGEIIYRGPNVMKGYYKDLEKTADVLSEDGWFRTGDLGMVNEEGYLFIKGRVKTMILGASGENIYPEAIESVLNDCDFVEESIVFQDEGRIVALVHFDLESMSESIQHLKEGAKHASEYMAEYTKEILQKVNRQLNSFSRISQLRHEEKPFEKTPKKTIKRYLYTKFMKSDSDQEDAQGQD